MKKLFNWELILFSAILFVGVGLTQLSSMSFLDIQLPSNLFNTQPSVTPTPTPES
ncbi:hypothetical protein HYW55_00370 [Candidatus Gottesmanbacteria bacterium]|nr:hypothetical protein [Candidatus Gottesmanbacteria bacterium]